MGYTFYYVHVLCWGKTPPQKNRCLRLPYYGKIKFLRK